VQDDLVGGWRRYGIPMIVLGRVLEASGRWPTPRAHTDLTHNPETGLAMSKHTLEQRTRECDLP